MIEAGANEIPEAKMIEAIYMAHGINQEIIAFIAEILAASATPRQAVNELMRRALLAGGKDNITAVVAYPAAERRKGDHGAA